ncbi:MAG: hypothetical protein AAGI49_16485, partial [Bacteroidota bacterium]
MNKLLIFLLLCCFGQQLFSQDTTNLCLNFEALPLDEMYGSTTGYEAGDRFFVENGIVGSLQPFFYRDGSSEFFAATVLDDPFNLQDDHAANEKGLFISNINIDVDFTAFSEEVTSVRLNFADGGGEENLAVNGEETKIVERISQLHGQEIAEGVTATFRIDSSFFPLEQGILLLEGPIKNLTIGGQEFFIDDLCVWTNGASSCDIQDLGIGLLQCLEDTHYSGLVNFKYNGVGGESFDYYLDGELLGTRSLEEVPLRLEFPYQNDRTESNLTVCITGQSDCCQRIRFDQPNCGFVGDCAIDFVDLYATECDDNGEFFVNFFVDRTEGGEQGYFIEDVFRDVYGPFAYLDSTVVLGPYSDLDDVPLTFTIIDAEDESCTAQRELFDICSACRFEEVFFDPRPCDENGQFLLDIFLFARGGSSEGFFINYMGELFGPFSYQDSIVTIGPLSTGFDAPPQITIFDAENPNCTYSDILGLPCGVDCNLRLAAELTDCDTNGLFFASIIATGGFANYTIEAGGRIWGPFAYGDRNIRIGPFQNTANNDFFVIIHDQTLPNCSDTLALESPCFVNDCGIENIAVDVTECRADGTFG